MLFLFVSHSMPIGRTCSWSDAQFPGSGPPSRSSIDITSASPSSISSSMVSRGRFWEEFAANSKDARAAECDAYRTLTPCRCQRPDPRIPPSPLKSACKRRAMRQTRISKKIRCQCSSRHPTSVCGLLGCESNRLGSGCPKRRKGMSSIPRQPPGQKSLRRGERVLNPESILGQVSRLHSSRKTRRSLPSQRCESSTPQLG